MSFTVEIQEEWFSEDQCKANPNKIYVFGDNLKRVGKGGQATIRDMDNSYGIATKRLPSMKDGAFFSDQIDESHEILNDIIGLLNTANYVQYDTIVLPADGLGTGLSKMPENSPKLCKWLHETLSLLLGVNYRPLNK